MNCDAQVPRDVMTGKSATRESLMKTKVDGLYDMVLMLGDGSTWSM